jgi:ADP-ribose pyrophosphatase YjhB (NUDIX family)
VSEEIIKDKGIRYHYVIIDFFAKVKGGNLRAGSDALEARWVSFDEIDELDVVDFVRKLVTNITLGISCIYIR